MGELPKGRAKSAPGRRTSILLPPDGLGGPRLQVHGVPFPSGSHKPLAPESLRRKPTNVFLE